MFYAVFTCFSPYWGIRFGRGGGGGPRDWYTTCYAHNLLVQFFTLDGSKIEVSETYVFDIVIT